MSLAHALALAQLAECVALLEAEFGVGGGAGRKGRSSTQKSQFNQDISGWCMTTAWTGPGAAPNAHMTRQTCVLSGGSMFDSPLGPRAKGLTVAKVHNELQCCSAQWGAHVNSQNVIK